MCSVCCIIIYLFTLQMWHSFIRILFSWFNRIQSVFDYNFRCSFHLAANNGMREFAGDLVNQRLCVYSAWNVCTHEFTIFMAHMRISLGIHFQPIIKVISQNYRNGENVVASNSFSISMFKEPNPRHLIQCNIAVAAFILLFVFVLFFRPFQMPWF